MVRKSSALQRVERPAPPTWNDIGEGFEVLGKVGLAMAVGFSAAGLFCRLAEQGKVRVPSLSGLVLNGRLDPPKAPPNPDRLKPSV
jgi:hypothetical protein